MKRALLILGLIALFCAPSANAQTRPEVGGTGSTTNTGADNAFLVGESGATSYGEEIPSGTCDGTSGLRFDDTQADGSRMSCFVAGDITDVFDCASGDCTDIVVGATDSLDFSAIDANAAGEGLVLPQTTTCGGTGIATGAICYGTTSDELCVWDGAAWDCQVLGAGGGNHTIISATHTDSTGTPAAGDLFYRNAGNTDWTNLAIGASTTYLKGSATIPVYSGLTLVDATNQGTTTQVLHGNAAGAVSWGAVDLANDVTGIVAVANGGSGADLSATGGANQFVRQSGVGSAFTVSAIADADVPDTITIDHSTTGTLTLDATDPTTNVGRFAVDSTVGQEHLLLGAAAGVITFFQTVVDETATFAYNGSDVTGTLVNLVNGTAPNADVAVFLSGYKLTQVAASPANDEFRFYDVVGLCSGAGTPEACCTGGGTGNCEDTITLGLAPASTDQVAATYLF